MYSPLEEQLANHATVGAMPINRIFHPQNYMSQPRSSVTYPFENQTWFGTSLDSTGSSFGQSPPPIIGRDVIVSPSTSTQLDDDESQQKNLQEMFEKRRRRRESHNAVERRRRENINERIIELSSLLPEKLLDTAPTTSNVMSMNGQIANGRALNKGTILRLSVDHIKELKEDLCRYQKRVHELEHMLLSMKPVDKTPFHFRHQFNNLQIEQ
ncbi:HLH-domain-containing protein [Backusella circina FSU 941]|nr:HLH-domain-containing protein [Backusella circina FSU 941]